jgi:dethiobiotin synthetase
VSHLSDVAPRSRPVRHGHRYRRRQDVRDGADRPIVGERWPPGGHLQTAASGCRRQSEGLVSDDAVALWNAAGRPGDLEHVCPQRFAAPLAPHLAAQAEGRRLDPDLLRSGLDYWQEESEIILVEGAGGLMSPLGDDLYVADLAAEFDFPLVVVSRNILGTINQTLQTLLAAAVFPRLESGTAPISRNGPRGALQEWEPSHRGLPIAGLVLNHAGPPGGGDASLASNRRELAARCTPPILTELAWGGDRFDTPVDWFSLAR